MKPVRVVLVEDHTLVRQGLRALLQRLPWVEVVGEAGDGREALKLIATVRPDVAFMDIMMQGLNGIEVTQRARQDCPRLRVIILSMHTTEEFVLRAMRAGASAYILKDAGQEELELALKAVTRNEMYLSPLVSKSVLTDYLRRVNGNAAVFNDLTLRQREVLQLIAEGHTTKEVADKLGISVKTADTLRTHLMERLNIHNIAGLVRYAVREGLVSAER